MKKNNKGLLSVEMMLFIVIIGLIGVVGWAFISRQNVSKTDNSNTSVSSTKSAKQVSTEQQTASQAKTMPTANQPPYTLDNAVADINKTLASSSCRGGGNGQVVKTDFVQADNSMKFAYQGGKSFINNDLTYAYAQYGCGSQGTIGFLSKKGASWVLVNESARIYPICADIRGQGFPASIIDKCYVDDNAVDPVKI